MSLHFHRQPQVVAVRYFVRVNDNSIKCFGKHDADKIAQRTGGKVVSVPQYR